MKKILKKRNKLKYENNIIKHKIILFKSLLNKLSILFIGKKPPDEIIVKDKFNESKVLRFMILNTIKITIVSTE